MVKENILHGKSGGRETLCNKLVPKKVNIFVWRALKGRLPVSSMSVWEKVFAWWKMDSVNAFSIDEIFSSNGSVNVPIFISRVWQAVLWTFSSSAASFCVTALRALQHFLCDKSVLCEDHLQRIQFCLSDWFLRLQ
ncbi:hypothetical protein Tco_0921775 [Tanacetum coccineum]